MVFGFALESLAQFGAVGEMSGQNFDRDNSIKARIAGADKPRPFRPHR